MLFSVNFVLECIVIVSFKFDLLLAGSFKINHQISIFSFEFIKLVNLSS
jgi:hypothetical protein